MNMKMKKWNSLFSVFLFCSVAIGACMFVACRSKPVGSSYTVTFGVDGSGGTVTAKIGSSTTDKSPISGLSAGAQVVFTASPDAGYDVEHWMVNNDKKNGDSYTLTVNADTKVTVRFVKTQRQDTSTVTHKVTIKAGEHGKITANPALPADGLVTAGTEIAFTATPDSQDYKINEWTIKGGSFIGESSVGTKTVKAKITADTEVSVTFVSKNVQLTTYTVQFSADKNHGKLTAVVDKQQIAPGTAVNSGKNVTFTAEPNDGYMLTSWTVNGKTENATELTRTIRITENTTVKAIFEKYHTITLAPVDHGKLTVLPELKDGKAPENTVLTFTATPDKGYTVEKWNVSAGTFNAGGEPGKTEATLTVTADATVSVVFKLQTFQVTYSADSAAAGLTLKAKYEDGTSVPQNPTAVEYGKKITFTAEESSKSEDKVIAWTITGGTADTGGKRGDTTAVITITGKTDVTVTYIDTTAEDILKTLALPLTEAADDFTLPTLDGLTWTSSNSAALKVENNKATVMQDLTAQKVKLTAALTRNGKSAERTFEVTIQPITKIEMHPDNDRTRTYTFDNGTLKFMKEGNGNKEGTRYAVVIHPANKTLTANLQATYYGDTWTLLEEKKTNDIENFRKTILIMQQLEQKSELDVSTVKEAFENDSTDDESFFNSNQYLFGGKDYPTFNGLSKEDKTQTIKEGIKKQKEWICTIEDIPADSSWDAILQKGIKNIEQRYKNRMRSIRYSYQLSKENSAYSITIQSVYDPDKKWYEQEGLYKDASTHVCLSMNEYGRLDITYKGKDYSGTFTDSGKTQFTAEENSSDANKISGAISVSNQQDGTLTVTIGETSNKLTFTHEAIK